MNSKMHIVQVVPRIGEEASGPSYTVPRLSRELARAGEIVTLMSVVDGQLPPEEGFTHLVSPESKWFGPLLGSPALKAGLRSQGKRADILHSHSLWLLPNIYPGQAARLAGIPLVLSPRGTLSEWALAHSKWRKRLVWLLAQRRTVQAASCIHATAASELEDIRRLGIRAPVCVIPNGIDLPDVLDEADQAPRQSEEPRRLLFLGRIHPKKGIENLVRAWSHIAEQRRDWELRIVGPLDTPHAADVQRLIEELRVNRVALAGPVYGKAKLEEYRRADLFVLPTHSENFGMTVAEALAAGTPAISTIGAPWEGLATEGAGWWIQLGVDALAAALLDATGRERAALASMGTRGRGWMTRDFAWDSIASQMISVYRWLISGGRAPSTVHFW